MSVIKLADLQSKKLVPSIEALLFVSPDGSRKESCPCLQKTNRSTSWPVC